MAMSVVLGITLEKYAAEHGIKRDVRLTQAPLFNFRANLLYRSLLIMRYRHLDK